MVTDQTHSAGCVMDQHFISFLQSGLFIDALVGKVLFNNNNFSSSMNLS